MQKTESTSKKWHSLLVLVWLTADDVLSFVGRFLTSERCRCVKTARLSGGSFAVDFVVAFSLTAASRNTDMII